MGIGSETFFAMEGSRGGGGGGVGGGQVYISHSHLLI